MQWGTSARGWVRNRQCRNAGFVIGNVPDFLQCAARTPNTQTHNINIPTIHPYAQASMHTYTHTHVCNTHMQSCILICTRVYHVSHDACRVRLLVLPIDDMDSANSACPKPRRAKLCREYCDPGAPSSTRCQKPPPKVGSILPTRLWFFGCQRPACSPTVATSNCG